MATRAGVETAVSDEGLFIPVGHIHLNPSRIRWTLLSPCSVFQLIDFSHFLHGTAEEKQACAKAIVSGFKDAGFIYLKNHGIPEEAVKDLFQKVPFVYSKAQALFQEIPCD